MSSRRFLCFGDSLTEGYTFTASFEMYPYSKRLKELLSEHYKEPVETLPPVFSCLSHPLCWQVKVLGAKLVTIFPPKNCLDTMGVSGEMVIDTMVNRLERTLTDAKSSYNWIIILGGTNDVGTGADPDKLLDALCQMHNRARATGARTAVLTIPQFALELMSDYESLRNRKAKVNEGLREYCATSGGQSICVDLFNELPQATLSPQEQKKYWCDGLHCTPQGYDKMAEIIFATLEKYL